MDIVILGSGNVAAVLGRKFKAAGHSILQIVSRNASVASKLAYEWDTESTNYSSIINRNADVYIIAVSDDAIEDVVADLQLPKKVDRKSTRLNSSHSQISYAVFCLKKKKITTIQNTKPVGDK